jgi:hypothetical protein
MNLLNKYAALLLAAIAILSTSCGKKETTRVTTPATISLKTFYEAYGTKKQTFTVNTADLPKEITLTGGTTITFRPNSFTKNGSLVTGDLSVEVIEVLKRSDMILSGTNTNYKDDMLESKGFLYISVKSNGAEVDEDLKEPMYIMLPETTPSKINNIRTPLFQGNENSDGSGQFAWQLPAGDTLFAEGLQSEMFGWMKLKWVNCDEFTDLPEPKTSLHITVENAGWDLTKSLGLTGNCTIFFCPKGYNSAIKLYGTASPSTLITQNRIPIGMTGKLVMMMIKDGKHFFVQEEINVKPDVTHNLAAVEMNAEDLKKEVEKLNSY